MKYCLTGTDGSDEGEESGLPAGISRRALLGRAAALAPGTLVPGALVTGTLLAGTLLAGTQAGCARREEPRMPPPGPDVAVLTAAIAAEERLIALYEAARAAHPELAERLAPAMAHHREHLEVLRRHLLPGTGDRTASPSGPSRPAAPTVPADQDKTLSLLRKAEDAAAEARADDVTRVAPGVAQLMACIGACEAGHAAALSGDAR